METGMKYTLVLTVSLVRYSLESLVPYLVLHRKLHLYRTRYVVIPGRSQEDPPADRQKSMNSKLVADQDIRKCR